MGKTKRGQLQKLNQLQFAQLVWATLVAIRRTQTRTGADQEADQEKESRIKIKPKGEKILGNFKA